MFGGWDHGVINIAEIVSSPADYLPRQWLWHVFQILMELRWKLNLIFGEAKIFRSAASWIPHRIISIPAQQQSGVARRCLARETWDEVIDNFELDVLETWEHPPLDFMTIGYLPVFRGRQTSAKLGYAVLASFSTRLHEEELEALPPRVARHFQEYPPKSLPLGWGVNGIDVNGFWSSDEDWYSELTASSGNGARVRGNSATAGQGSLAAEGQSPAPVDTLPMLSTASPSFTTKCRAVRPKTASGISPTLIEDPKQSSNVTFYQNHEYARNEEIRNGASYEKTAPADDSLERRPIPGAWDNEWEPEERSFADVSQAAYKWWAGCATQMGMGDSL